MAEWTYSSLVWIESLTGQQKSKISSVSTLMVSSGMRRNIFGGKKSLKIMDFCGKNGRLTNLKIENGFQTNGSRYGIVLVAKNNWKLWILGKKWRQATPKKWKWDLKRIEGERDSPKEYFFDWKFHIIRRDVHSARHFWRSKWRSSRCSIHSFTFGLIHFII